MADRQPHADGATEIVHHERKVAQVERERDPFEIVDVVLQPIAAIGGRGALAESHVIDGNDTVMARPGSDLVAEQIGPGRLAV